MTIILEGNFELANLANLQNFLSLQNFESYSWKLSPLLVNVAIVYL